MSSYFESLGQSLRKQWPKGNCYCKVYPNTVNPYFTLLLCKQCSHEGSGVHKLKKKSTVTYRRELLLTRKEKYKTFMFISGINQS